MNAAACDAVRSNDRSAVRGTAHGQHRHVASVIFAACALAYVALAWSFRYLPTCDGPLHLASAVTWARFDEPGTRYREFYVFSPKQVPNLTSQFMLATLVRVMNPLAAEKVLVTFYVVGAAAAYWYFVTTFGCDARWFAPLGLLCLLHRAFFTGLYNYCLSLIALWLVAGYCARRSSPGYGELDILDALRLAGLLTVAYCTHLVGWVLSVAAAFWFTRSRPGTRARNWLYLVASAAPSLLLAINYGMATSMAGSEGVLPVVGKALGNLSAAELERRLALLGENVFGPLAPPGLAFSCTVFISYEVVIAAAVLSQSGRRYATGPTRAVVLAAMLLAGYFVLPDNVGRHGGLLVIRLAFLPPMLLVGLLRLPAARIGRCLSLGFVYGLLLVNLAAAIQFFRHANADIEEYLAGANAVRNNSAIFSDAPPEGSYWPRHLRHAAGYYCLTTGNITLDNSRGGTGPFWIHFREGIFVGRGDREHYLNRSRVDYVLVWNDHPTPSLATEGYSEVFSQGRLHVFALGASARNKSQSSAITTNSRQSQ